MEEKQLFPGIYITDFRNSPKPLSPFDSDDQKLGELNQRVAFLKNLNEGREIENEDHNSPIIKGVPSRPDLEDDSDLSATYSEAENSSSSSSSIRSDCNSMDALEREVATLSNSLKKLKESNQILKEAISDLTAFDADADGKDYKDAIQENNQVIEKKEKQLLDLQRKLFTLSIQPSNERPLEDVHLFSSSTISSNAVALTSSPLDHIPVDHHSTLLNDGSIYL